jgi:hypothetical protein
MANNKKKKKKNGDEQEEKEQEFHWFSTFFSRQFSFLPLHAHQSGAAYQASYSRRRLNSSWHPSSPNYLPSKRNQMIPLTLALSETEVVAREFADHRPVS